MDNNILGVLKALEKSSLVSNMKVFGSYAKGHEKPSDIDVVSPSKAEEL